MQSPAVMPSGVMLDLVPLLARFRASGEAAQRGCFAHFVAVLQRADMLMVATMIHRADPTGNFAAEIGLARVRASARTRATSRPGANFDAFPRVWEH